VIEIRTKRCSHLRPLQLVELSWVKRWGLSKICWDSSAVCMPRYKPRWQAVLIKASDLSRLAERLRQPLHKSRRRLLSVGNTLMSQHKQATRCSAAANYSSVNSLRGGPALSLPNCQASVPASQTCPSASRGVLRRCRTIPASRHILDSPKGCCYPSCSLP